ncbi:MAG: ATP-dependent helicase HrpB [Gemmataceae bacterium]
MSRISLPIDEVLNGIRNTLKEHNSLVLQAPTGAGKTTRVPPTLLDAEFADTGRIVMLEPRRLAARAAARRMASERGGRVGDEIGYHVRFDRQFSKDTKVLVVTPGILLRMLHTDPFLESVAVILFDEFHERNLESDLALGMVRLIQQTVRPELRMVVMSATLETEAVAKYLDLCPVITSEGRLHPVEVTYEDYPSRIPVGEAVATVVKQALKRTDGDLLVFLPGVGEIRQTERHLEGVASKLNLLVYPLYGDLPADKQDLALLPQSQRKVVLATNVAETSVTVEGVTGVIDTGLERQMVFDPRVGLDRLLLGPISQASADQRKGRAGRTQPGICVRIWSEAGHRLRPPRTSPEIQRVDLAGAVLHLLSIGETDLDQFPWLEPPPPAAVEQAHSLLARLGAVADNCVTELGRLIARLPVHPRLARLLIEGHRLGHPKITALAAALLSERDPFLRESPGTPAHQGVPSRSDLLDRVDALEEFDKTARVETPIGTLNRGAANFLLRTRDQLLRTARGLSRDDVALVEHIPPADEALLRALVPAFSDRLARRKDHRNPKATMVGGQSVQLAKQSNVVDPELFLCLDVDVQKRGTFVRMASGVQKEWLPEEWLQTTTDVFFAPAAKQVVARRVVRFDDLILESAPVQLPKDNEVAKVLSQGIIEQSHLPKVIPPEDSDAGRYLLRLRCLHDWLPDAGLPAFGDEDLAEVLEWLCVGCRSMQEVQRADWLGAIKGKLTYEQQQLVENEVPDRYQVPSGSRLKLTYKVGRPPVLAVRIQEVFGLRKTPTVAKGRVPIVLHLLAPNNRPQQVTEDLASFWVNTYPNVRKDLRGRYPKHAWPEDPLTATPEKRPQRKKS